jgi:DNA-directed RNA polymerase subunit RPC12/RpoP
MKPKTTLKELIKSPFHLCNDNSGIVTDDNGWALFALGCPPVLIEGWFRQWVVVALNEKWERDFEEPMRWIEDPGVKVMYYKCPVCASLFNATNYIYCPRCGRRLLPPKEKEINQE